MGRPSGSPAARATRVAAVFASGPAVVLGVVAALVFSPLVGLAALIVGGLAAYSWARFAGDRLVAARVGGKVADEHSEARLCNLVDGLSATAGLRAPQLRVVESPGLNAMAAGTTAGRALIAVTSGLLAELERIELEAVLAEELSLIRRGETLPATVLVASFGFGYRWAVPAGRDSLCDEAAVALTRYPPALVSALEKIRNRGAGVGGVPTRLAHLWLADPLGGVAPTAAGSSRGRTSLDERIASLRDL